MLFSVALAYKPIIILVTHKGHWPKQVGGGHLKPRAGTALNVRRVSPLNQFSLKHYNIQENHCFKFYIIRKTSFFYPPSPLSWIILDKK